MGPHIETVFVRVCARVHARTEVKGGWSSGATICSLPALEIRMKNRYRKRYVSDICKYTCKMT